jgi:DNA-directed RNA polymerase specialized sigma24 family protein
MRLVPQAWDADFDRECQALVKAVCGAQGEARTAAWHSLLLRTSGPLEVFIVHSALLQRCRLAGPDDVRAVLVEVISRLARHDFENLKAFLAAQPPGTPGDEEELQEVERLSRAAGDEEDPALDEPHETPLRGWLLGLLRFTIKDHAKKRLGWSAAGGRSRRDLTTDAERLDDQPDTGVRPPITDLIALRQMASDMLGFAETFPRPMRDALELWMQDVSFEEIAVRVGVDGPAGGRALVRAAQARLREKFRTA